MHSLLLAINFQILIFHHPVEYSVVVQTSALVSMFNILW